MLEQCGFCCDHCHGSNSIACIGLGEADSQLAGDVCATPSGASTQRGQVREEAEKDRPIQGRR